VSAATEIAEREALEAEAENPDAEAPEPLEGDPAPVEPEPEPEPEPSSQTVVEAADKRFTTEAKRHENALAKLHPDDWDTFAMCPLCIGDGFLTPIAPGEMPDQIWEAVTVLSGRVQTGELQTAPYAEVCETCAGYGMVLTGARNETNASLPCRTCAGYGWLDLGQPQTPGQIIPNAKKVPPAPAALVSVPGYAQPPREPYPDSGIEFQPFIGGANDPYGRPAGHPRWGMPTDANGRQL
jgi:hypothetical protein